MSRFASSLRYALVCLVVTACGGSPELIDRTQPNYVRKADLLNGTWYIQETVIDVPPTTGQSFEGMQSGLEKVRFEVQEKHLVAFRSYEVLVGSDPNVDIAKSKIGDTRTLDGKRYRGAPIAAWPISSHFDRQRQYNAATGEQSNVLEENTSDRPWYERDFIRVEWGANAIVNPNFFTNADGEQIISPYVQPVDQNPGEDAFTAEYSDIAGVKRLDYFDFVTRQFWAPQKENIPGYGEVPYCWINPRVDCESTVVKTRMSVKRVDEARVQDYEPLIYDDKLEKRFGFFRTQRLSYDRLRGVTETGRLLYANRHNLWMKSKNADGSPIPVERRELRPIVYHLSPNYPKELMPAARDIEKSWDTAFRRAYAVPRNLAVTEAPQVFFLCETPVPADAPEACGPEGTTPRMGDLRFNVLWWVDRPQMAGPLGYGPSAADPETGEIVQAGAYMYGASLDVWTGDAQTVLEVISGQLTVDELIAGRHVRDFAATNFNATDPRRPVSGPWASSQSGLTAADPKKPLGAFGNVKGDLKALLDRYQQQGGLPLRKENRRAVVAQLIKKHPALEAELVNAPEVRALVLSKAPGRAYRQRLMSDPALYRTVARDVMLRFDELDLLEKRRIDRLSKANIWMAEFSDDAFYGLAREKAAKYQQLFAENKANGQSDEQAKANARGVIWTDLRNAGFRGVAEHEVGHTLGLMHNFQGSFDALNYKDGYWDLRKETIGVKQGNTRVMPVTAQDLLDASKPNQRQLEEKMGELQYSSIMDYGARMNGDVHGIGKYDEAAILFVYSGGGEPGYVEVFNENRGDYNAPNHTVPTTAGTPMMVRGAHAEIPLAIAEHYTPVSPLYSDRFHYTTLPFHFADKGLAFEQALDQGISRMQSRSFRKWSEMKKVYDVLEDELRAFSLNGNNSVTTDSNRAKAIVGKVAKTMEVPVEVPYMYCSDYEVSAALSCNRWDMGADYFEMTRDWIKRYEDYYVFSHFKRDRYEFSPNNVLSRVYTRLLANLPNVYQQWFFDIYIYGSAYPANILEEYFGAGDPITQNYWTMAVTDATNLLMQNMATPAAGYYGLTNTNPARWVRLDANNPVSGRFTPEAEAKLRTDMQATSQYTDIAYVPRGPGRNPYTLFENDGYDFFTRTQEVGHFWDQYAAMMALTSSETTLLGVDRGADALQYSLPFYLAFPQQMSNVFTGVFLEDGARYSGQMVKKADGTAELSKPIYIRAENFIEGFSYPPLGYGVPTDGSGAPLATQRVDSPPSWSTRFYAQFMGMAYFTENFNQDFATQNQVFRLGSGETVTPDAGLGTHTVVSIDDPTNGGYTYAAVGRTADITAAIDTTPANVDARRAAIQKLPAAPAAIALARWNKERWDAARTGNTTVEGLTAAQWEAKVREDVRNLELMRGLYQVFSQTW